MVYAVTHERFTTTAPSSSWNASKTIIGDGNVNLVNEGDRNRTHIGHDNRNNQGVLFNIGTANFPSKSNEILNELRRAPAYYDSSLRKQAKKCMRGTRMAILNTIYEWVDRVDNPPIFWLYGQAGTGKSTIAHTVAEKCRRRRRLGASFFFTHDRAECSDPDLFFSTIAYQLSMFDPDLRKYIMDAVDAHPSPQDASIPTQFEEFMLTPLRKFFSHPTRKPIVVVVDAFDECHDPRKASEILQLLSAKISSFPLQLKIFITSRPEPEIWTILHADLDRISRSFDLRDVGISSMDEDIKHFLRFHLSRIGKEYYLPSWPREVDVETLAQQAGGLFIFVHTVIELIRDKDVINPESQLAMLKNIGSSTPGFNLNALYSRILQKAIPETASTSIQERIITIIHSVVGLRTPLAPRVIERLLGFESGALRAGLNRLRSIFIVPDNDEEVVQVIHPSFARYITDQSSCTEKRFFVTRRELHSRLAKICLKKMKSHLKKNICNFKDFAMVEAPIKERTDVDFQELSAELRYSCENFAAHVLSADWQDSDLCEMVVEWANQHLLYWLEVLTLIGSIRDALPSLRLLGNFCEIASASYVELHGTDPRELSGYGFAKRYQANDSNFTAQTQTPKSNQTKSRYFFLRLLPKWFRVHTTASKLGLQLMELLRLLSDVIRMVSESYDDIKRFPYQIYTSCLAFCPSNSRLFEQYSRLSTVRVLGAERRTWGRLLHTFKDPDGSVGLALSSEETTLASLSSIGKIHLWDLETGESRLLVCHTPRCRTTLKYSPNNKYIAAGGNVYSITTGEQVVPPGICSAFSSDGQYIAVGCANGTIRLYNMQATNLSSPTELFRHKRSVTALAFFPDNRSLASTSLDDTIRVWNSSSAKMMKQIRCRGSGGNITFSPNGMYAAALCKSFALGRPFLWIVDLEIGKGKSVEVDVSNPSELVMTFSPRGEFIALGNGAELYVIATAIDDIVLKREFKTVITSVSFALGEHDVLVGNKQGMIRLWKFPKNGQSTFRLDFECKGHVGPVQAITFSRHGKYFASTSMDGSICLWDSSRVDMPDTTGYTSTLPWQAVVFAPDGRTVAIGSSNAVSKMDAMTGYSIFHRRHDLIHSQLTFSADGKYLAGNRPQELLCWDTGNYYKLTKRKTPARNQNSIVVAYALSPDAGHYAVRFSNGDLIIYNLRNNGSRKLVTGHPDCSDYFANLKFSHDSKHLLSYSEIISMFDVEKGKQTYLISTRKHINDCAFSPFGRRLAIVHGSGLDVFEYLAKKPKVGKVRGRGCYRTVAFSPDATYILTGFWVRGLNLDLFHSDTLEKLYKVNIRCGDDLPIREFRRTGRLLNHPLFQPSRYKDFPYLLDEDGWVITASSKRLCRLPVANRGKKYDVNGNRIIVVSPEGKTTLIQFGPNAICVPTPPVD